MHTSYRTFCGRSEVPMDLDVDVVELAVLDGLQGPAAPPGVTRQLVVQLAVQTPALSWRASRAW
eukprot:13167969-Heterocapsa_arctica.AAC.1